jgi:large subunit ribosomal protein L7/L12
MAYSEKVQQIVDIAKGLTLLEAKEVVDAFKEEFDVEPATGGPAVMVQQAGAADAGAEPDEPTEFNVVLKSYGESKVNVIKCVRNELSLGLKDAKEVVESAPRPIKEGIEKAEADKLAETLQEAGAEVEVVPAG